MWLFIPSECLACVPAGAGSISGSAWPGSGLRAPGPELFVTLNGKAFARPLWWRGWRKRPWIARLFGTVSKPSTAGRGAARWIASLADSPASPTAWPESAKGPMMPAGYGRISSGLLARWDQNSYSWKTFQTSLIPALDGFSGAWPRAGMMQSGIVSARPKSEPATKGNGFSSWPTARVTRGDYTRDKGNKAKPRPSLEGMAKMWATPQGHDSQPGKAQRVGRYGTKAGGRNLADEADFWATPRSSSSENRNTKNAPSHGNGHGFTLAGQASTWASPCAGDWRTHGGNQATLASQSRLSFRPARMIRRGRRHRPRLNPLFVEWLMGWPIGWTSSACWEMELYRYRRRMRSALCGLMRGLDRRAA